MTAQRVKSAGMRQESFIARHQNEWNEFETWLVQRGEERRGKVSQAGSQMLRDEDVPERYRRLCQQLALARSRGYSPLVVARLQALTQRGHAVLYRAPPPRWSRALWFLLAGFPRLVRAQRGCLLAAFLLFVVPMVATYVAVRHSPELVYSVMDPAEAAQLEEMYNPDNEIHRLGRDSGGDLGMFGFYIMNNISIGLATFASGLLTCFGTVYTLVTNGLMVGGVAAHLENAGRGEPFWRFVPAHSAPELTAIVIAGVAGLQLGLAVFVPGQRRRVDALIEAGRIGAKLSMGVFAMLLLAAFIEAFWSSIGWIPAWIKYAVGAVLWALTLLWLWRGGQGWQDDAATPAARTTRPASMSRTQGSGADEA